MISRIPRISVLVITYKQEDIVGRTLDSLIAQKEYLHEICVSDDCSPDNTWQVLLDYKNRYPDLIKIHRNDHNVGIFENTEYTWSMPTGDVINQIAGDDTTPNGWYRAVVEYITKNKLDYENELFCIYGDYRCVYPNGDSVYHKQEAVSKYPDAFRLALRKVICERGCCFSIKVLKKFKKLSVGRSHIAEDAIDRQLQIFSEKNYYIPQEANIYYSRIGISTKLTEEMKKERMKIIPYSMECFEKFGIILSKSDRHYMKYIMSLQEYLYLGRKMSLIKMLWYYLVSFDLRIFRTGDGIHDIYYAIKRRMPHKRPIS